MEIVVSGTMKNGGKIYFALREMDLNDPYFWRVGLTGQNILNAIRDILQRNPGSMISIAIR